MKTIGLFLVLVMLGCALPALAGERCAKIRDGDETTRVVDACQLLRLDEGVPPARWNARRCTRTMILQQTQAILTRDQVATNSGALQTLRNDLNTDLPAIDSCGDGVLDPAIGEECDDGNVDNGDGCDEVCLNEP